MDKKKGRQDANEFNLRKKGRRDFDTFQKIFFRETIKNNKGNNKNTTKSLTHKLVLPNGSVAW